MLGWVSDAFPQVRQDSEALVSDGVGEMGGFFSMEKVKWGVLGVDWIIGLLECSVAWTCFSVRKSCWSS